MFHFVVYVKLYVYTNEITYNPEASGFVTLMFNDGIYFAVQL